MRNTLKDEEEEGRKKRGTEGMREEEHCSKVEGRGQRKEERGRKGKGGKGKKKKGRER